MLAALFSAPVALTTPSALTSTSQRQLASPTVTRRRISLNVHRAPAATLSSGTALSTLASATLHAREEYQSASEYDLNVGRLIDTLRHDYPRMLVAEPDLSLFVDEVQLHFVTRSGPAAEGPAGVPPIRGKQAYRTALKTIRSAHRMIAAGEAEIGHRMVVSDRAVRVRWTARLWVRRPLGTGRAIVDGISVYELDARGLVRAHRVENIATSGGHQLSHHPLVVSDLGASWAIPGLAPRERRGAVPC